MSDQKNDGSSFMLIIMLGAAFAIYRIVQEIAQAVAMLLQGLVIIALVSAGILAAFWVYRYLTDQQYGETKNLREIEKLERERKLYISRLPEHLREGADEYYKEKQSEFFNPHPQSRLDVFFDRSKQFFSTFGKKER
jgi:hypothetical protein